ncbi:hypothetical protein [Flavobacterium terrigena]|uniref:Uncharacterized protein n=1 Tax=Flavobacterium terrigena TaxID=402734 RepID=A0A1H6X2X9_9FLAO|nr:hypothetical protein [Flavobacterium terrigena]SEJ21864.1 hypothetical protein SAMN05660918_2694 [Flavobacterium terrigena]
MKQFKLNNVDSEDIEDAIIKIEKSFNIKFEVNELSQVKTFGELSDAIIDKIQLENIESCTTQQAFYKIRKAISELFYIENIKPETKLVEIFPRKNRRKDIKKFEKTLGFKTDILNPKTIISITLTLFTIASLIYIFFNWKMGLLGIITSIFGLKIANIFGKEFHLKTIGELSKKITKENYLNSRRDSNSFNKKEIESIIIELFCEYTAIKKHELTRESTFV